MTNNIHTVCPADYKQNGNVCTKTVSTEEICYLNPGTGEKACFDGNGNKTSQPAGSSGKGSGSTGTGKKQYDFRQECSDVLKNYHSNIVQNIKELQVFEKKQFEKLQALETSQVSPESQEKIIAEINNLSSLRENLFNELQLMLTKEQCELSNDRYDLADQISLLKITENELQNLKANIAQLKQSRSNKLRMVEISNYEANRYKSHMAILKNIAYCSLGILVSVFLVNKGWRNLGNAGIVLSIAIAVMLTGRSLYDNWQRNSLYWNRYNWSFDPNEAKSGYETVYQHDVKAFWKSVDDTKSAAENIETTGKKYLKKGKSEMKALQSQL